MHVYEVSTTIKRKLIRYVILSMKTNLKFIETWSHNFEENRMKVKNEYKAKLYMFMNRARFIITSKHHLLIDWLID